MANYAVLLRNLRATDNKWITMKGSEEGKGRKILLDDQGNIIGGDVPKSVQGKPLKGAFKSEAQKTIHKAKATKTQSTHTPVAPASPQSKHFSESEYISHNKAKNIIEAVMKSLKVDKKEAKAILDSLEVYTLGSYTDIRKAERNNTPGMDRKHSNNLSTFIDKSPKWESPAYRGIQVDKDIADKLLASKGQDIDMGGTSSWSSSKNTASSFSLYKNQGKTPVLFQVEKPGRGTSIRHLSSLPGENEVLVHKDQKYKVEDAKMQPDGFLLVTLKAH